MLICHFCLHMSYDATMPVSQFLFNGVIGTNLSEMHIMESMSDASQIQAARTNWPNHIQITFSIEEVLVVLLFSWIGAVENQGHGSNRL